MQLRQLQELKRNVPQYRKDFIRLVSRQDSELDAILDDLLDEIDTAIKDNSSGGKIQDQDRISFLLPAIFAVFALDLLNIMKDKNRDAADIQRDFTSEEVRKLYTGVPGFSNVFNKFTKMAENYVNNIPKNLPYRGFPNSSYTIGGAIKTVEKDSIKVVRSILSVGIREGKSAREIANDISMYVKPLPDGKKVSPFTWVRDFLGRPKIQPNVPAGSVSFNAFRIARTEINNTYRSAVVDLHKDQPWLEGYIWNLSRSHPKIDICDEYADGSPYKTPQSVPRAHPHCMCYITMSLLPAKEVKW